MSANGRKLPESDAVPVYVGCLTFLVFVVGLVVFLCFSPPQKGGRNVEERPPAKVLKEGGPW